jgi:hypothetical protein
MWTSEAANVVAHRGEPIGIVQQAIDLVSQRRQVICI